jgi:hypothetical protein
MSQASIESVQQTIVTLTTKVEAARAETRRWQVVTILTPVIVTAALGLLAERWKASIQERIDNRSQQLSTRLAITEEFYKRKLTVHEQLFKQLVGALNGLKDARFNTGRKAEATNGLAALYANYTSNGLYISPDLLKLVKEFVRAGNDCAPLYPEGKTEIGSVEDLFNKAQRQMGIDLQLLEFSTVR